MKLRGAKWPAFLRTRLGRALLLSATGVVLVVVIRTSVGASDMVVLPRPIPAGPGAELVGYRLEDDRAAYTAEVTLYLRGRPAVPVGLELSPVGVAVESDPAPDLKLVRVSRDRLHSAKVAVPVPSWARRRGGTYVLRVPGHEETFGSIDLGSTRR